MERYDVENILIGQRDHYLRMQTNIEEMMLQATDDAEKDKYFRFWLTLLQIHGARTVTSKYALKQLAKEENRAIIETGNLLHLDTFIQSGTTTAPCMEEEESMGRKDITYQLDGITYRTTGQTAAEAVENAVKRHTTPTQPQLPLFGDYAMKWETLYHIPRLKGGSEGQGALNNKGLYKNHIMPVLGEKHLDEITMDTLQAFFNQKAAEGLSKSTIDKLQLLISGVLQHAYENNLIPRNVARSKSITITGTKEKRETLSAQQVKILVSRLDVLKPEDRLFVTLPLFTGMRRGEYLGLTWENIDLEQRLLYVRQGMNTTYKGNQAFLSTLKSKSAERTIGLFEPLAQMLEQCPCKNGFAIGGGTHPITAQTYKRTWERIRKRLDTGFYFTAHVLRHPYVKLKTKLFTQANQLFCRQSQFAYPGGQ